MDDASSYRPTAPKMASQTALGQPAGLAETEPRWSEDHRDAVSASTGPPAMPSPGLPPARQASCSLRKQASLRGLPRRLHRSPIQQAGSVPTAPGHPATPSAPPRALLRPPPVRFQHAHVGAEATQPFGDHDQQAHTRPNRPRRRPRDRPRWRRGGQQASETPSRPQRERAKAVAAAKAMNQRLWAGFAAAFCKARSRFSQVIEWSSVLAFS